MAPRRMAPRRMAPRRRISVLALFAAGSLLQSIGGASVAAVGPTGPGITLTSGEGAAHRPSAPRVTRVDVSDVSPNEPTEAVPRPDIEAERLAPAPSTTATDPGTINTTPAPTLQRLAERQSVSDYSPMVAVGPDHVIQTANEIVTITNREGGAAASYHIWQLLQLPGPIPFYVPAPRIHFDIAHGRFVMVVSSATCDGMPTDSFLLFAISDTANPLKTWSIYTYDYTDAWPGQPSLGTSGDKFVIANRLEVREDGSCTDVGWEYTAYDWADVLDKDTFPEDYYTFSPADPNIDSVTSVMPAVEQPGASSVLHAVADMAVSGGNPGFWHLRLSGSVPGTTLTLNNLSSGAVIPAFGPLTAIPQGGGPPIDARSGPLSAVVHGDRLVVTSTEDCMPTGDTQERACGRLVDVDVSASPPSKNQDFYLAANAKSTYSPAAGFALDGNLFVTYTRSSLTEMPSPYVTRQAPTDAPETTSPSVRLMAGAEWSPGQWITAINAATDPLLQDGAWVTSIVSGPMPNFTQRTALARTSTGNTYVPLPSTRVLDTRSGPGNVGLAGPFSANIPRTFDVAGVGDIPPDAVAVTANVTVTGQTSAGYLAVTPSPQVNPTSSTINFPLGDNRGNNTTLPLSPDGTLSAVFKAAAGKTTQLIVDVTGYFLADETGATYQPLAPARILDSRAGVGVGLSGRFQANTPRGLQVTGTAGVPAGALAVTGNLSVVNQTRGGYVSVTPDGDAADTSSALNFPTGDVRGNGLTAQLGPTGKLWLNFKASQGTTDLIFDVTGYYLAGTSGLRFYPLNPARIMDTRFNTLTQLFGTFKANVSRTLVTGGHFGVPGNAKAVTGNLTAVGQTSGGYVGITLTAVPNPPVSSLNFPLGDVRGNGVTVPLNGANDMVLIYKAPAGRTTHLIMDLTGYFR